MWRIKTLFFSFFFGLLFSCDFYYRDDKDILLYENLQEKYEKYWSTTDGSLWIPIIKKHGPYMYLGDERYTGEIIKYYKNGNVEFYGVYEDGRKTGLWKYYFSNNRPKLEIDYSYSEDCSPYRKEFFPSGKIKTLLKRENGCDTTYFSEYYQDGKLMQEYYYPNPSKKGLIMKYKKYREDGKLYEYFKGDSIYFLMDKKTLKLKEKIHYKSNKKEGLWESYNINESFRIVGYYKNNKLDSNYTEYFSDGLVKIRGRYNYGNKEGNWSEYYKNGNLKVQCYYKEGEFDKDYKEFYENGNYKTVGSFRDLKKEGKWIDYFVNGNIECISNYKFGLLDGTYIKYNSN
ncbi:MAG: hypothetical protein KDD29_00685, partial [Flavobacteriales bacterium]|nr:hypothetical protein [Flavobacteriales bacterium]